MNYNQVMEDIGDVIDAAGVAVIVVGMLISAGGAVVELRRHETGIYRHFRQQLGRTILLGLELLVVGDIVRTVAAQPTLRLPLPHPLPQSDGNLRRGRAAAERLRQRPYRGVPSYRAVRVGRVAPVGDYRGTRMDADIHG